MLQCAEPWLGLVCRIGECLVIPIPDLLFQFTLLSQPCSEGLSRALKVTDVCVFNWIGHVQPVQPLL